MQHRPVLFLLKMVYLKKLSDGRTRINFAFPNSVLSHNFIPEFKPEEEEINVGYGTVKEKEPYDIGKKIDPTERQILLVNSIYDVLQDRVPEYR